MVPLAPLTAIFSLAFFSVPLESAPEGQAPEEPVTVEGTILDRSSGEALEGVRITLEPGEEVDAPARTAVTDARGHFAMGRVPEGHYTLEARHIGYGRVDHHFRVTGEEDVAFDIQMVAAPIELSPVVARATAEVPPRMRGFYDRRERGIGRFIARDEIEARNPFQVTDLFRTMAGVRVQPGPGHRGARVLMRRGCEPTVYIDGIQTHQGARHIDDFVSTGDIEAVEVYNVSEVPGEFDQGTCGVVALWTRPPGTEPGEGRPWSWRRALVALSIVGLFFLR